MNQLPKLAIALSAVWAVGCEQAVELEGIELSQTVISSRIMAGAPVVVDLRVVNSFGRPSTSKDLDLTEATLSGSDGSSGDFVVQSATDSTARLLLDSLDIVGGLTYTLHLQAPGFAELRSVTTVPAQVQLSSTSNAPGDGSGVDTTCVRLPLHFEDQLGTQNFYHLIVGISEGGSTLAEKEIQVPARTVLMTAGVELGSKSGAWYFTDQNFREGSFQGEVTIEKSLFKHYQNPVAVVELRSVSRAYYSYYTARSDGRQGEGSLSSAPQLDNIVGGLGLFGSYSLSLREFTLR